MKPSQIVLHPSMGTAVVDHLRQFGDLPNRGILAGQAVDSAITDLFGKGGGVYNDLDIFRNVPRSGIINPYARANNTANRSEVDLCRRSSYNGMALIMEVTDTYHIKSVSRQGMLNFVNCNMAEGRMTERLTPQMVLSGFDLNCTRVAVDLATGQLVWDKNYEEFLRSRQLRITMMHTPWHTLLRLAKKAEELPDVYVDFEAAAQACVGVANSRFVSRMMYDRDVSLKFGSKHLELAKATRHRWDQYFTLESEVLYQDRGSWKTDKPEASAGQEIKSVHLHQMHPRGELDGQLQRRCDLAGKGILFFASKIIDESRRAKPGAAKQKLSTIMAHRAKATNKPELDYVLQCAKIFGSDYVQGQALPEVADKVAEWLKKHSSFTKLLLGQSLAQQHARMQEIAEVSREFGRKYYNGDAEAALGVLETQATLVDLESRERMEAVLMADYRRNTEPFSITPLPLPTADELPEEFRDFTVMELLTPEDLRKEGSEMGHCVGGYAHKVRTNRARILRIKYLNQRTSLDCSTVELSGPFEALGKDDVELEVVQNRSVSNKSPTQRNEQFLRYLVTYLEVATEVKSGDLRKLAFAAMEKAAKALSMKDLLQGRISVARQALRDLEHLEYGLRDRVDTLQRRAELLGELTSTSSARATELIAKMRLSNKDVANQMIDDALREAAIERGDIDPTKPQPTAIEPDMAAYPEMLITAKQTPSVKPLSLLSRLRNAWNGLWSNPESGRIA